MTDEELLRIAQEHESSFVRRRRSLMDFRYDEQQEKYWDLTTGILLGARSVDGAIHKEEWPTAGKKQIRPSVAINDIDSGLTVEGSTWWPGMPQFIENHVVTERGAMRVAGASTYNSYCAPPSPQRLDGTPQPWLDHVRRLYPDPVEHEHFFDFCAHAIQRPDEKINHGIVMSGAQGIGKDTALLPVRRGVGEWNAAEIAPDAITSPYNGYVQSVLLIINEVRPHDHEHKASNFYNMLKPILASPPDMLPMTLKYANTIYVRNLSHVILTTNDPLTMYIPPEDRRLFVMNSNAERDLDAQYFEALYSWFDSGGIDEVIGWLASRDISAFLASATPALTSGKEMIIESAHSVRRSSVDELIEMYVEKHNNPHVIFQRDLSSFAVAEQFDDATKIRGNTIHYKMSEHGYDLMRNPTATEWRAGSFRSRLAFCSKKIPPPQRMAAVELELEKRR